MIENDQPNLHFLIFKYSMDSRFSEEVSIYSLQPEHYYFVVEYRMNRPHGIIYKGMFLENDESIQFNNTILWYYHLQIPTKNINSQNLRGFDLSKRDIYLL